MNSFFNNSTGANLNMNQRTFDNLEILNNYFEDNSSGLILGGGGYGPYLANVSIKKNIFYKNANGLSISTIYGNGYNGCSGTISFPLIIENTHINEVFIVGTGEDEKIVEDLKEKYPNNINCYQPF
jgi:polygalacturonase